MTREQKNKLDNKMHEFDSFKDFHSYAYENGIYFDIDEWQEYSDRMKKILNEKNESSIYINTTGLILPNENRRII